VPAIGSTDQRWWPSRTHHGGGARLQLAVNALNHLELKRLTPLTRIPAIGTAVDPVMLEVFTICYGDR